LTSIDAPLIDRPLKIELFELVPPEAVAVLVTSVCILPAEIKPLKSFRPSMSALASMLLLAEVVLTVSVDVAEPAFIAELYSTRLAELVSVVGSGSHAKPTCDIGPEMRLVDPVFPVVYAPYAHPDDRLATELEALSVLAALIDWDALAVNAVSGSNTKRVANKTNHRFMQNLLSEKVPQHSHI